MEGIYRWVQNITCYMIFAAAAVNLLSNSKYEKYLRFFGGMVLILLVVQPLTGSLDLEERLAYLFQSFTFRQDSADLEKRLWGMEEERLNRVIASYEDAVSLDLEAMARAEGYEPLEIQAEIGKDPDSADYGQVTRIWMRLGPVEEGETGWNDRENEGERSGGSGEMQIRIEPIAPQAAASSGPPGNTRERAELNAFVRKVAGYYGLEGTEVAVEWEDDQGKMDPSAVGGSGADAPVFSGGQQEQGQVSGRFGRITGKSG